MICGASRPPRGSGPGREAGRPSSATGVYGTRSTTDVKLPGARASASVASDASGNLWLFGGSGYDANGAQGALNDFWEYQLTAAQLDLDGWLAESGRAGYLRHAGRGRRG